MGRLRRLCRIAVGVLGTLGLVVISGCSSAPPPDAPAIDRIVVTPSALLFTDAGQSARLTARAFDADGNDLDVAVNWRVRSGPVTVDGGLVTSTADLGSGLLVAEAGGVASFPVPVLIAEPVPETILITDDQVVGTPAAVDDLDAYGYGWRYQIELRDLPQAPTVDDIVMSSESHPISGRVIDVVDNGDTYLVTLAIVEVAELFARLDYNESIDLTGVRPAARPDIADLYEVRRNDAGGFVIAPRPGAALRAQQIGTRAIWSDGCNPPQLGPSVTLPTLPTVNFDASGLTFDLQFDLANLDFQKFEISGDVNVSFQEDVVYKQNLAAKITCTAVVGFIPLPISPPLAAIIYPGIGLGLGFELEAKITSEVKFDVFVQSTVTPRVGLDCTSTCAAIGPSLTSDTDVTVKPTFPGIDANSSGFKFETGIAGFAFAALEFTNPILRAFGVSFQAITIKAGLRGKADLEPKDRQAAQSTYGSNLSMELFFGIEAGIELNRVLSLLQKAIDPNAFKVEFTRNLFTFPTGSVAVTGPHGGSPPFLVPGDDTTQGDLADFDIDLDSRDFVLFPGGSPVDLVENVELFWWKEGALESGRPPCTTIDSSGTRFTCSASFLEEHVGDNTFYAFVNPKIFGISIPIPLEVGKDGKAELFVDPAPEIPTPPASDVTIVPAETETDVAFAVPFDDLGENIAEIRAEFELVGNPVPFTLMWSPDEPTAYDFTGTSGTGVVGTSMFIFCSERGNNPINVTFTLTDELDQVSNQDSTSLTVDYSGCPATAATPDDPPSRSLVVRKIAP